MHEVSNTKRKFKSSGGLGDSWIVFLKIIEIIRKDPDIFDNKVNVEWLHIESHNHIKDACEQLFGDKSWLNFSFECDPNYIQNIRANKWKDYASLSTSMNGFCSLHGQTPALNSPFIEEEINDKIYDICIQTSAGAKNNRGWKFDPRVFATIFRQKGCRIAIVGNNEQFKNESDDDNLVSKLSIIDTLSVVRKSRVFIGLSGFLNYYACSVKVPNIHVIESEENEKRYYHDLWRDITIGIEYPSLQAVREALEKTK